MAAQLQTFIKVWKEFNFASFQRELDNVATDIATRQDESDQSRKKLVEQTREFKKSTPDETRKIVGPILKCFQFEIDNLTKRSIATETSFLNVYKRLVELPDPKAVVEFCHGLQAKAVKADDLEIEVKQLRETLKEYNEEFKEVRNQDVTIKQLREKIKHYEEKWDETLEARCQELQADLQSDFAEKEQILLDNQLSLTKKLRESEHRAIQYQAVLEQAQSELFDLRSKDEDRSDAKSQELELIINDLDRANQRASLAEKEVNQLREQLAVANQNIGGQESVSIPTSGNDMEKAIDLISRSSMELEIAAKEKEIAQLLEDVQRLQTTIKQLRETYTAQITQLEEQLEKRDNQIQQLQNKLDGQKDYEDIKRELSILKSIEFANIVPNVASSAKSLETLLLEKTKSLQNENTSLKLSNSDLSGTGNPSHLALMRMLPFSPLFQNVDSFGSILGEEVVGSWRRMLERTAFSQGVGNSNGLSSRSPSEPTSPSLNIKTETVQPHTPTPSNGPSTPTEPLDSAPVMNGVNDLAPPCNTGSPASGSSEDRPSKLETSHLTFGESLIPKGDPMEARLQEMLRKNMEKYADQNLDTFYISRRVRELLSIHNIGQRVFAKYILGLSQGTVSELLSKPKPWDKLTEKGRDSYRKMHSWACDESAIYFLKSLVPKKGEDSAMSPFKSEDTGAEERIASILSEASQAMRCQQVCDGSDGVRSPASSQSPPLSKDLKRPKKYENDDIPPEKVLRIYQDELAKLMGRPMDDLTRLSGMQHWPSVLFPFFSGALPNRQPDDIQMALNIYHQELSKFSAAHMLNGVAQDLSVPKREKDGSESSEDRKEDGDRRHSGSAFTLVRPKTEAGQAPPTSSPASNILSMVSSPDESQTNPLQRMQSITNSLISQPSTPSLPMPSPRPLKAVLPPITQYQFDKYQNLNTEDIVKKVKEQLSQYSISQRLFGESVLGLSQGSVSDLLARPKPWHMLTQKGREPFIRMKIFLEDENAVHKLVASQYKIAPEKLMRTGGYGEYLEGHHRKYGDGRLLVGAAPKMMHPKVSESPVNLPARSLESPLPPTSLATSLAHMQLSQHGFSSDPSLRSQFLQETLKKNHSLRPGHVQPSVYEMAALTQDLDTQLITTKIKETLLANNIGQKLFGEAVLGLSQGSVSELLSKPKPWHMLSIKGREPFIRMQLWLNDPHNLERLQQMKNERREANKRRRSQIDINDSSNESGDIYNTMTSSPGSGINATKKQRVLFSEEQKEALRLAFALDPYPNMATIEFLGEDLGLNARTITNWFHNHRMRLKQQIPHSSDASLALSSSREGQNFDPVHFRVLLNQRLLELRKDRSGLAGLAGSINFPYFAPSLHSLHKEQMNGLDLTIERPPSDDNDDQDNESDNFSVDSPRGMTKDDMNISGDESESKSEDRDQESVKTPVSEGSVGYGQSRSSRRKPAAPQWVNPDWQAEDKASNEDEVIINGVCVMQTDPYVIGRNSEETIRIDPTPVDMSEAPGGQSRDKDSPGPKCESPLLDNSDNLSPKSLSVSEGISDTSARVTDSLVDPR